MLKENEKKEDAANLNLWSCLIDTIFKNLIIGLSQIIAYNYKVSLFFNFKALF